MGLEDSLYSELVELRDGIREDRTHSTGRVPTVCTDEALREMAQRVPTKAEDFAAIPGVGQRFVELYGDEFLSVTKKYAVTAARGSNMEQDVVRALRELQKKLTNISRNNRLLYMGKLYRKNAFDLTSIPSLETMNLLFGKKKSLKLCDSTKSAEDLKIFKNLTELIREVNRDQRDKGQYDLYIGYPFIEGRLPGEDFDVRAPLALFPVILDKDAKSISVRLDDSRDAIYNNALLLAFIKFSGKNKPLPYNVIEEYSAESFMSNLATFYESQGFPLKLSYSPLTPFIDYREGEFPKYLPGDMKVVHNAILGKFPSYSSYIQKDFDELLAGREINAALSNLVKDLNQGDFYSDMPSPLSLPALREKGLEASEKDITYINTLNSAQENVITAVNKEDELVVHGPPGTGKSQVITGLITSAVNNGKTVLMVSEKKTALDVVYSRLGPLSKYCLLIDDTSNKDQFYQQLGRMLEAVPPRTGSDLAALSDSIDKDVSVLSNIAETMYHEGPFGIEPYKLYSMDKWLNLEDKIEYEKYKMIKAAVSTKLMNLKYKEVKELTRKFNDRVLMTNFNEYSECLAKTPWFAIMKQDLSEYNIGEMKADLMNLELQIKEWKSKGAVSRMLSKGKVNRDATALLDKYFVSYNEKTIQTVIDDPKAVIDALKDYELYSSRATVYNRLNEKERIYGHVIVALSKESGWTFEDSNNNILKYILNEHLQKFDADHKALLQDIQDFDSIVADMDRKINDKKNITKNRVEEILQADLRYITESKRRGDIVRIIENKRKWSLNKFLSRYSFEMFKGVKIWLLTPEVVSEIMPLEMGLFDLLIFDEASQMYVEKGIPAIYRAKKVVIAGDHKQLRPSNLGSGRIDYSNEEDYDEEEDEVSAVLEEESLLDLARTRYDNILLNFHYRSQYEELIAFSNYAFYGGRLYVSPNVVEPERPPIEVHKVSGEWANKANVKEARIVVDLLKDFFKTRKNNETIGIITFNVSQRDLINDLIDDAATADPDFGKAVNKEMVRFDNGEDVGLFIKNIESVQGDERDVVIFSIGYAKNKDGRLMQRFGWLNNKGGENRLNVAISRSKKKIHIVLSFDPEELQVDSSKNDGPRILKKYLQYAEAVSNGNKELAQSILNSFGDNRWVSSPTVPGESPINERVYNALVRKGYSVEKEVGIGGYTIDMAIKQDGRYILGIECDSHIYEMSDSTRERDYHRQKYLESRGWHIHRVWTSGMWKDPQKEINNIVKAIEKTGPRSSR
ncbi:ATP-dependent RecD-like DNA helicase [Candidatus Methanoplasma termitum]|uniref:RecD2 protein n=1 Tax=Candidatus Methanoplasma termitum TaxID=1577791 RepID=A0A0A7LCZ7_9ARCH|nr:AAA domain-containing protein [Candidatus Methanoplasma termitum]AIZ56944.1 ATP-dependent RecD-like DNA helicase [Candidatus Methanoplasma termitum]